MHIYSSSSAASSTSSLAQSSDSVEVFFRNVDGRTFALQVSPTTSISELLGLLERRTGIPEDNIRLTSRGQLLHRHRGASLSALSLDSQSTVSITMPLLGGAPKKIRCGYKECKDAAQRIVGDCGFCNGHFCGKHRLLEDHKCEGLEDCKKQSHEQNAIKLNSERTVAIRGI